MKYLTVAQYLNYEDSVPDLDSISALQLGRYITRAETLIDTYVGFDARIGGFEPHTAWYEDAFDDQTRKIRVPNYPVPVRSIDRFRIQVSNDGSGQGFFATIQPSDCVINVFGGYIEVVPLQAITYALTPYLLGLSLRPPLAQVDFKAGFYFPVFGETLTNDEGDLTTYHTQRGFLASSVTLYSGVQPNTAYPAPPVVYVNGVAQASNTYSLNATEGIITFASPLTDSGAPYFTPPVVTCDYTYQIPDAVRDATIAQTTFMLHQRALNMQGLGAIEVARNRDQQIKRHIRQSAGSSVKDEPALDTYAMQLLEPYANIPIG